MGEKKQKEVTSVDELQKQLADEKEKNEALVSENESLIKENEKLVSEKEELDKQAKQNKDDYIRNVAEFDNYKKRNAKLYSQAYSDGKSDLVVKFLAIGDGLDRALSTINDEQTLNGINLLIKTFDDILSEQGIEKINPKGEKFNPELAEAVVTVADDQMEEDTVKDVYQLGYKMGEKVIRYAKVSVVK